MFQQMHLVIFQANHKKTTTFVKKNENKKKLLVKRCQLTLFNMIRWVLFNRSQKNCNHQKPAIF